MSLNSSSLCPYSITVPLTYENIIVFHVGGLDEDKPMDIVHTLMAELNCALSVTNFSITLGYPVLFFDKHDRAITEI